MERYLLFTILIIFITTTTVAAGDSALITPIMVSEHNRGIRQAVFTCGRRYQSVTAVKTYQFAEKKKKQ